jgi:hypothetical protein
MDAKYSILIDAKTEAAVSKLSELDLKTQKLVNEKHTIRVDVDGNATQTINQTFKDTTGNITKVTQVVDSMGNTTKTTFSEIGKSGTQISQTFGDILKKVSTFFSATVIIQQTIQVMKEAVATVKEYDAALTDFKKVSDLSGDSLTQYTKQLGELGESVARTKTEMISGASEFKKSGFNDEDSAQLSKLAALYQNVADEELSAADASGVIISEMKAFNMTAEDASHIIDSINEVSNNFAVSSGDIGKGLTAAGAALSTYGNSFDEVVGLTKQV